MEENSSPSPGKPALLRQRTHEGPAFVEFTETKRGISKIFGSRIAEQLTLYWTGSEIRWIACGLVVFFLVLCVYSIIGIWFTGIWSLRIVDSEQSGVDDWGATQVASYLKDKTSIYINVSLLEENDVDGHTLFDGGFDDELFDKLGVAKDENGEGPRDKILNAIEQLDKKVTENPKDGWEWRVANRRLCDTWLLPMYSISRGSLLIWLRHIYKKGKSIDALEKLGAIHNTSTAEFTLTTLFIPNYPFLQLALDTQMQGLKHYLVRFIAFSAVLDNLIVIVHAVLSPLARVKHMLLREGIGIVISAFLYYVAWFVTPKFLEDVLFFEMIFFVTPAVAIFSVISFISSLWTIPKGEVTRVTLHDIYNAGMVFLKKAHED